MKEYYELFCSNDETEIDKVKEVLQNHKINFNLSINNAKNVIFGISPLSNICDLSYKYQIQVKENDLDNAEDLIKELFSLNNEIENVLPKTKNNETNFEENIDKKETPTIARLVLLILVFCHISRFFEFVSKNRKNKSRRNQLNILEIMLLITLVGALSINYIYWFSIIVGLISSILLFWIYQFLINLIDFIITKNKIQGYSLLVLLGLIFMLLIGVDITPINS